MRAIRSSSPAVMTEKAPTSSTFLDITASSDGRDTMVEVVARTAEQVFIPLTVGGGVRTAEDARRLLRAGADKVGVNTAALNRPELVEELAGELGAQCVVAAVDARARTAGTGWEVYTHGGREPTGVDAVGWAERLAALGAGRFCSPRWTAMGPGSASTWSSPARCLTPWGCRWWPRAGVGTLDHLVEGATTGGADAVLAASIFHRREHTVAEAKEYLADHGVPVRPAGS